VCDSAIIVNVQSMNNKTNLYALTGWIGSGKDTVADLLENRYGWHRVSFAGALKDAVSVVFDWPRELLEGRTLHSREWREMVDTWWANRLNIPHLTPRWVLQNIGTDVLRHHFHDDIWIASVERRLMKLDPAIPAVISDCRFPNEIQLIREYQGQLVQVIRSFDTPEWYGCAVRENFADAEQLQDLKDHALTMKHLYPHVHSSEYSWVGHPIDYKIINTQTLTDLEEQVDMFTQLIKNR